MTKDKEAKKLEKLRAYLKCKYRAWKASVTKDTRF